MASTYQRLSGGRLLREHRDRCRAGRARPLRRPRRQGHPLRADRRVPRGRAGAPGAASPFDFEGQHYERRRRDHPGRARTRSPTSTSVAPRPPPSRSPRATSTCTSRGASRRTWSPSGSSAMRALAAARGPHAALRHPVPRDRPRRPRPRRGRSPTSCSPAMDPDAIAAAQQRLRRHRSPSASGAWPSCTAVTATRLTRCTPTCGRGSASSAAASAPRSSAAYDEVADRIVEYADLGFDEFILSGYPHLEEAYWFGEGVHARAARARAPGRPRRRAAHPCSRSGSDGWVRASGSSWSATSTRRASTSPATTRSSSRHSSPATTSSSSATTSTSAASRSRCDECDGWLCGPSRSLGLRRPAVACRRRRRCCARSSTSRCRTSGSASATSCSPRRSAPTSWRPPTVGRSACATTSSSSSRRGWTRRSNG